VKPDALRTISLVLSKLAVLPLKSLHLLSNIARQACLPQLTSVFFTHACSVEGKQSILVVMDETATQCGEMFSFVVQRYADGTFADFR